MYIWYCYFRCDFLVYFENRRKKNLQKTIGKFVFFANHFACFFKWRLSWKFYVNIHGGLPIPSLYRQQWRFCGFSKWYKYKFNFARFGQKNFWKKKMCFLYICLFNRKLAPVKTTEKKYRTEWPFIKNLFFWNFQNFFLPEKCVFCIYLCLIKCLKSHRKNVDRKKRTTF